MKGIVHLSRFFLVTAGVLVVTALSVDATQYLSGSQSALTILSQSLLQKECPEATALLTIGSVSYCIDVYEVSSSVACPHKNPSSALASKENIDTPGCVAQPQEGLLPWTNVSYLQARELCSARGAVLPTPEQWYVAALGTPDDSACAIDSAIQKTGTKSTCRSNLGTYDQVGNVWEWVDAQVTDGYYQSRELPKEGYVADVDVAGMARLTTSTPQLLFENDYFWSNLQGQYAIMRGGFYGSKEDAGVYSVYSKALPTFTGPATGFRCIVAL